jgi:hypothetical protein
MLLTGENNNLLLVFLSFIFYSFFIPTVFSAANLTRFTEPQVWGFLQRVHRNNVSGKCGSSLDRVGFWHFGSGPHFFSASNLFQKIPQKISDRDLFNGSANVVGRTPLLLGVFHDRGRWPVHQPGPRPMVVQSVQMHQVISAGNKIVVENSPQVPGTRGISCGKPWNIPGKYH